MVAPDEMDPHREGDRNWWVTDDPEDIQDFWESAPTFEKWRKGGKWN